MISGETNNWKLAREKKREHKMVHQQYQIYNIVKNKSVGMDIDIVKLGISPQNWRFVVFSQTGHLKSEKLDVST